MSGDVLRPEGACAGCPYRSSCHEPRRHVMAALGEGRHRLCDFYQEFRAREARGGPVAPKRLPRIRIPLSGLFKLVRRVLKKGT